MWVCYTHFETDFGWMGLIGSATGLRRILLPQPSPEAVLHLIAQNSPKAIADPAPFGDLPDRLRRYFAGEQVAFTDALDMAGATPFSRAVWQATRLIPYGETRSYSWIALQIERPEAWRAVGQALAKNPFPIIVPCHRVLGKDGNLCGFSGGLEMKKRLLEIESSSIYDPASSRY